MWPIIVTAVVLTVTACSSSGASDSADGGTAPTQSVTSVEVASGDETTDQSATSIVPRELTESEQQALDSAVDRYVEDRSVDSARQFVELVSQSGSVRYAPWLVDLAQLGVSNLVEEEIIDVLGSLVGVETTGDTFADFGRMGSVVETQGIDPGPGYRRWKLALLERLDPEFRPLLESVTDTERFNRIRYGGVRRGGIPELNDPARISAAEALEWITEDEVVLGVDLDGEVVAYPFRIVGHHELVNDTVAGNPVSLVYCTLCRTGLLFNRRVDGQVLDFQTSGLLINSNKIMVDRQTDTLWHHAAGLGIGGLHEGVSLEQFPMETTTWADWYARYPETEVLEIPGPIFFDEPERPPISYPYEPGGPYNAYYENPNTWYPIREASDALDVKAEVLGIEFAGGTLAVAVDQIVSGPSRYLRIGDGVVVVVPNARGARVYATEVVSEAGASLDQGAAVDTASLDTDQVVLADGSVLQRLAVDQGFWFSWYDRFPDTEVWPL
ncbi:MAG: DUF3179 domain-containing (seleno)protein [Acidimicrobiales bacterium]